MQILVANLDFKPLVEWTENLQYAVCKSRRTVLMFLATLPKGQDTLLPCKRFDHSLNKSRIYGLILLFALHVITQDWPV